VQLHGADFPLVLDNLGTKEVFSGAERGFLRGLFELVWHTRGRNRPINTSGALDWGPQLGLSATISFRAGPLPEEHVPWGWKPGNRLIGSDAVESLLLDKSWRGRWK
jgi:hypothetical protein